MSSPAWLTDPTGRHQYRWWDGEEWTENVADDGVQSVDPVDGAEELKRPAARPVAASGSEPLTQLASRGARLGARLIDSIFLVVLTTAVLLVLDRIGVMSLTSGTYGFVLGSEIEVDSDTSSRSTLIGVIVALGVMTAIYEIAMTAMKGQTLGKMATRTAVVRAGDLYQADWGRPPSWRSSLFRWGLPTVLSLIPGLFIPWVGEILALLCYLSLTWDRDRQGWHDKAAGTLVVKKP